MPVATEEFVISGFSGRFPHSDDVEEFKKNLFDGVDMVIDNHGRWSNDDFDMSCRMGVIRNHHLENIDGQFFTVSPLQCKFMDPQMRMLMESTFEAIVDAGKIWQFSIEKKD